MPGLRSRRGPPAAIVDAATDGRFTPCFDERILAEYRDVLARKKLALHKASVEKLITDLGVTGRLVPTLSISADLPDPRGNMFVEVAISGRPDYLVTGNLKDFPARATMGVAVVSPREFYDLGLKTRHKR